MRALPGDVASNGLVVSCCIDLTIAINLHSIRHGTEASSRRRKKTTNPDACVEDTIIKKRFIEGQVIGLVELSSAPG